MTPWTPSVILERMRYAGCGRCQGYSIIHRDCDVNHRDPVIHFLKRWHPALVTRLPMSIGPVHVPSGNRRGQHTSATAASLVALLEYPALISSSVGGPRDNANLDQAGTRIVYYSSCPCVLNDISTGTAGDGPDLRGVSRL
jgi:hypothetical protein